MQKARFVPRPDWEAADPSTRPTRQRIPDLELERGGIEQKMLAVHRSGKNRYLVLEMILVSNHHTGIRYSITLTSSGIHWYHFLFIYLFVYLFIFNHHFHFPA